MPVDNFPVFAQLVAESFQAIAKSSEVFVAGADGDALYEAYLAVFPAGTNLTFKKRPEHECSTCRQFIRRAGNVVAVDDQGAIRTVWEEASKKAPYPYNVVAAALHAIVITGDISDLFRVSQKEGSFGAATTRSLSTDGKALTWNHLHTGPIPKRLQAASPDQVRGDYRTTVQVFTRGLVELEPAAIETVLALIDANNLYRGAEHRVAVVQFKLVQAAYLAMAEGSRGREIFAWTHATGPAARFRNTVIGTLVQDLSEGKDVEHAVKAFETKVAPTNYKRTTAVITPAMVQKAMATIEELGLEPALERRFATIADISVNDVLWVDNSVKPAMKGGLGATLMQVAEKASAQRDTIAAEDIGLDAFIAHVLPEATGMEVLLKGEHLGNLMSLTAPIHPEPKQLFRWGNDFAWSYRGNAADSYLRQQVQSLGGRVDGVLRFSHMWNHDKRNASLMDLHVFMPGSSEHYGGDHDCYPSGQRVGWNRRSDAPSGGVQDVDYVQAAPEGYVPVENITFPTLDRLKDGAYTFKIHNWALRQPTHGGFRAEIEFGGRVFQYDHPEPLRHKEWITLAVATLKNREFTIEHKHPMGTLKQEVWGLTTEQYVKVDAVTLSPNYWGDNAVGNKHTFFVLHGAKNDEPTRGIYNEFLHPRLETHRKVFEVIGDKTKCQPTEGQLSGLGFSSTKRTDVIVRVQQGKKQRLFNVHVGA